MGHAPEPAGPQVGEQVGHRVGCHVDQAERAP